MTMTPTETDLYQRICEFNLDEPGAKFPFSHKLAQECQWTRTYTVRTIQEYKKFMFLGTISDCTVSPSVPIDLVWHLHLIYTDAYWNKFCIEVLGKPFHHNPSLGGKEEKLKYDRLYQKTLATYQDYFGTPPLDIWIDPATQPNHQHYWMIPNPIYWLRLITNHHGLNAVDLLRAYFPNRMPKKPSMKLKKHPNKPRLKSIALRVPLKRRNYSDKV
jgi:hypothetical protein